MKKFLLPILVTVFALSFTVQASYAMKKENEEELLHHVKKPKTNHPRRTTPLELDEVLVSIVSSLPTAPKAVPTLLRHDGKDIRHLFPTSSPQPWSYFSEELSPDKNLRLVNHHWKRVVDSVHPLWTLVACGGYQWKKERTL